MPLFFIAAIVFVAIPFGRGAAYVGCIAASLVFAILLFEPVGSLTIRDANERMNLVWMLLGGIAGSYFVTQLVERFSSQTASRQRTGRNRQARQLHSVDEHFAIVLSLSGAIGMAILWWVLEHPAPGR